MNNIYAAKKIKPIGLIHFPMDIVTTLNSTLFMEIKAIDNVSWKKIDGTDYSVSSCGQFRNDRRNRIKKQTEDKDGYLIVNLHSHPYRSHRIVAEIWLKTFKKNLVVNHKNFNRKDNRVENLEVVTVKQNAEHSASAGRYRRFGEKNNNCKRSDALINKIRDLLSQNRYSDAAIGIKFDVPRKYVNNIKLGNIRNGN